MARDSNITGDISKGTELIGKTIKTAEVCAAPYGHTFTRLLLLTFSDGKKAMLLGSGFGRGVDLGPFPLEEMRRHPSYFTPENLGDEVKYQEEKRQAGLARAEERRRYEYGKLYKEFGGE